MISVYDDIPQRSYFSFYDYEYALDVKRQYELMPQTIPLERGLIEAFEWYREHPEMVMRKDLIEFIDRELKQK